MEDEHVLLKFLGQLKHKWILLVLAAAGILLVAIGGTRTQARADKDTSVPASSDSSARAYREALEADLTAFVGRMEGVGEVRVLVTLREGESYTYSGGKLVGSASPRIEGVAVLCEGCGDDRVRREVTQALSALLGVGAHKIYVGRLSPGGE